MVAKFNQTRQIVWDYLASTHETFSDYEKESACKELAGRIIRMANGIAEMQTNYKRMRNAI